MVKKKFILVMSLIIILGLSACAKTEKPEQSVNNALNAVKTGDTQGVEKYFRNESEMFDSVSGNRGEAVKLITQGLEFKILESGIDEKTATVKTELRNIDYRHMEEVFFVRIFELDTSIDRSDQKVDELLDQVLVDVIKDEDINRVSNIVDIHLEQFEGEWEIILDTQLTNAIFGNDTD